MPTDKQFSGPIVIAGGSGFLGVSLAMHLATSGAEIVILSRSAPNIEGPWRHALWDARTPGEWCRELNGAAGLVNLVGRSVDCIKTPDHCDEILRSRVDATRVLGTAVRSIESPPPVWVQMSTAHIYGDPPTVVCDETSCFGTGLAPFVGARMGGSIQCQRVAVATQGCLTNELRNRSRSRRGRRRTRSFTDACKVWPRRTSRQRDARDELDSRTRHESPL